MLDQQLRADLDKALAPMDEATRDLVLVALSMSMQVTALLKHPDMERVLTSFRYLKEGESDAGQDLPRMLRGIEFSGASLETRAFKVEDERRQNMIRLHHLG